MSISVSVILASVVQFIVVNSFFMRNLPNGIRGAMLGVYNFFANAGLTMFALVGGIVFDKLSSTSPFTMISVCDILICALAMILFCCGYIRS